jgi:hypothetical protein
VRGPLLLVVALALGCRFGGPTEAPDAPAPPDLTPPGADGSALADAPVDSSVPSSLAEDAAPASDGTPGPDGCSAPFPVVGCDPVCNTGCPPVSRCDVGAGMHTGTCVGRWVTGEGQPCFKGEGTDACAARLTCVEGTCRRLCYRDGDCGAARCCSQALPSGFGVCGACAPAGQGS